MCVQYEIPGLFGKIRIALDFAYDRDGHAAMSPSFVKPELGVGRVATSVTEGIRHRRLGKAVLQHNPAWQFYGLV
ncbi:hypothetical protein GCM10007880_13180 [Mesorhizobium amorphae]|nr:hypothetical protein GCM10007880_13180 [Mesorhizobium amorphae]